MAITEKDYIEALRQADNLRIKELRAADQRAIELLALAQAAGTTKSHFNFMLILAVLSLLVAVATIFWKH